MSKADTDTKLVKALAGILSDTGLTELEYETDEIRIKLGKTPAAVHQNLASLPSMPAVAASGMMNYGGLSDLNQTNLPVPAPKESAGAAGHAGGHVADRPGTITSPMVGTVYLSPDPSSPAFVRIGDLVTVGQSILIIEAMKVMNPLLAPHAGRVTEILVRDGHPVEFGEALMVIEA
ncbi:MAG: acetyl-CoA carboxylase, biotin carboxyl carrier protein [Alphaproteobacteria bacterium]|nr:acetyl-CoA carboxylase, biotin carboxyl carrier protein [Alphaproteobacteria bacterium]